MVKKNQLRKFTIQRIMEMVEKEINGEDLLVYTDFIENKNKGLIDRRDEILRELERVRKGTEKAIR